MEALGPTIQLCLHLASLLELVFRALGVGPVVGAQGDLALERLVFFCLFPVHAVDALDRLEGAGEEIAFQLFLGRFSLVIPICLHGPAQLLPVHLPEVLIRHQTAVLSDNEFARLFHCLAFPEILIPLLIVVQVLFHGVLDDLHPLDGSVQLCLREAVAPERELQHLGSDLLQALVHGLRHSHHVSRHGEMGHEIPIFRDQGPESRVVVVALDADELAGLLVELVGNVMGVTVGVAADEVQDLEVGNALHASAVEILQGFAAVVAVLLPDIGDVHTLGLLHKGALNLPAVLVDDLHGDGLRQELRHVEQLRHGAHGGVAAVHPGSVVDSGDQVVVEDGCPVVAQGVSNHTGAGAEGFFNLFRAQLPLGRGAERCDGIEEILRIVIAVLLVHTTVEGADPHPPVRVLGDAQETSGFRPFQTRHEVFQDILSERRQLFGLAGKVPEALLPAFPDPVVLPGRENPDDLTALVIQEGQRLAGILGASQLLLQLRAAGVQGQSPYVL